MNADIELQESAVIGISAPRWCAYFLTLTLALLLFAGAVAEGTTQLWTSGKHIWAHRYDIFVDEALAAQATKRGYALITVREAPYSRQEIIEQEAESNRVHPDLIRAIITKESAGKKYATSESDAAGLMQVLQSWAPKLGLEHWSQLYEERTNIRGGSWILGDNMKTCNQDVYCALVIYRVGPKGTSEKCDNACAQAYAKDVIKIMMTRKFKG